MKAVKATTRQLRPGESKNDFTFMTEDDFTQREQAGAFAHVYTFSGHRYGIPQEISWGLERGKNVFLIVTDYEAAQQLTKTFKDRRSLFSVLLYADERTLSTRLLQRGAKPDEVNERMKELVVQTAVYHQRASTFDCTLFSENFEGALGEQFSASYGVWSVARRIQAIVRHHLRYPSMKGENFHKSYVYDIFSRLLTTALPHATDRLFRGLSVEFSPKQEIVDQYLIENELTRDAIAGLFPQKVLAISEGYGREAAFFRNPQHGDKKSIVLDIAPAAA